MRVKQIHFFTGLKGTTQNFSLKAITSERCLYTLLFMHLSAAWLPLALHKLANIEKRKATYVQFFVSEAPGISDYAENQLYTPLKGLSKGRRVLMSLPISGKTVAITLNKHLFVTTQACINVLKIYSVPASHLI